jgi:transcriptional regulator with XRE-family HTH domain
MISEDLKRRRELLGMTQKQLAKAMFVTERTVQRWESGEYVHPLMRNAWQALLEEAEEYGIPERAGE